MSEFPASVRYVKNGAGGRWWAAAKSRSQIHAGWGHVPDDMIRRGDLAKVEATIRTYWGNKQGATQDVNAIRALLQSPSQHVWVTFEDGFMWWATARDGVTMSPNRETSDQGHFWLDLDRPWDNRSLSGRYLARQLPGIVTTTAGFKGTVCEPKGWPDPRLILDEEDADATDAMAARLSYQGRSESSWQGSVLGTLRCWLAYLLFTVRLDAY